jgi:Xaa-Pro dipeptidase
MPRILPDEYGKRLKACTGAMKQHNIDCLFLLPGSNFTYFTGVKFMRERYRLLAALITREGKLIIMGPTFEEAKMGNGPLETEVHTWTDEDNQYSRVAQVVEKEAGRKVRLGIELTGNYYHYLALLAELPEARFVDPVPATDRIRATKSKTEIECLREAAARTRARMEKVPSQLSEGMTELALVKLYGPGAMVQFGLTTSMPNEIAGTRKLQKSDIIVIDAGDRVEGYRSDLTRTFFFGEPSEKMREVYRIVNDAELAAIDAAKPGAPAEVIDLAARAVIEKAGYGEYFTHRGGHGLGLDFHEFPICVRGNKEPLEPGMVLTAEPGIYLPGEFGMRLEDDILITEAGHELISERGPLPEPGFAI